MQNLNISVVQTHLIWEDIDANLNHFTHLIENLENCDLIILPEMFSTGFSMNPKRLALESTNKTIPWLIEMATKLKAAICGSFMHVDDDKYYNAFAFVHPNGNIQWYYKRHLFSPGEESTHFSKGLKRLVLEYKGWKICPLICYDLRFPVFSRNTEAFELMIYVANWPAIRNYAWQQLLKARAIENQCYVVACNRLGEDGNGVDHIGNSCIVNYLGEEIGFSNENKVYTFNLNKASLLETRKSFPVLNDADEFELKV